MSRTLIRRLTTRLALAALALIAHPAMAAPVTYTVEGRFTGRSSDDALLIQALSPLLSAGQALSLTLSLDTATPADGTVPSASPGGDTLYRAVTGSSARFAGFDDGVSFGCPSSSVFICSVHVRDGQTRFADADRIALFPAMLRSQALEAASGLGGPLSIQVMAFFMDVSAQSLTDNALDRDLTALDLRGWVGSLSAFSFRADGSVARAAFEFSVDSLRTGAPDVSTPQPQPLPEPASLALTLLALTGLAVRRRGRNVPGN